MNRIFLLTIIACWYQLDGMFLFQKSLPQKTHEEVQKDLARGIWVHRLPMVLEALANGADPCEAIPDRADGVMFRGKSILYHAIAGYDYAIIKALVNAIPKQKLSETSLSSWAYHDIRILKLLLRVGCPFADDDKSSWVNIEVLMFLCACGREVKCTCPLEESGRVEEVVNKGKEKYQQRLQKYQGEIFAIVEKDLLDDIYKIVIAYVGVPLDWDDILLDEQEEKEKLERAPVECTIQ